jgi:hypothetical protein
MATCGKYSIYEDPDKATLHIKNTELDRLGLR